MKKKVDIESVSLGYTAWKERAELPMTLMGGTIAMRAAGEKYLPKDQLEKKKNYENRLNRTTLFNAFKKTLIFLSGQVFKKQIAFSDKVPESLLMYNKDADLNGASFNFFAKQFFNKGMVEGCCHLLVESNNKGKEYTNKQEEKEDGIRSYFRIIPADDLFAWIVIEGKLVQVRFYETVTEKEGEFEEVIIKQIRVLEPGIWKVYRIKNKRKGWEIYDEGTTSLDYIPIVTFIPGQRLSFMTGESPLIDLAELNLDHWQLKSDLKNIMHVACVPLLLMKMIEEGVIEASAYSAISSNDKDADMKYVEITGRAIELAMKSITDIESKMALFGLQQLIPRTGNQTATEKALNSAESNSALGSNVDSFEACLREALTIAAEFETEKNFNSEEIKVNRDFTSSVIDAEIVSSYASLVDSNVLSAKNTFAELQSKGFISDSLDWLENLAEINSEKNLGVKPPLFK